MSKKCQKLSNRAAASTLIRSALIVGVLLGTVSVDAGSVFMKNGYIIQGPVVERGTESIVVGWENGKVTIYRRFVDSIVYDPGEEERLDEWERIRAAEERATQEALARGSEGRTTDVLPQSLEEFIDQQGQQSDLVAFGATPGSGLGDPTDPGFEDPGDSDIFGTEDPQGGTVEPTVDVVPSPSVLGERVVRQGGAFALRPPSGWTVRESEEVFELVGPTVDGVRPSLNAITIDRGELTWDDCVALIAEARSRSVDSFESFGEGSRRIAQGLEAFEVVGRATRGEQSLVVRQVAVVEDDRVWLFSSFTAGADDDASFTAIDECLASLEFLAKSEE